MQTMHRQRLRLGISHDRDEYFGRPQVGSDLGPEHGHVFDSRIAQAEQHRHTDGFSNGFGSSFRST